MLLSRGEKTCISVMYHIQKGSLKAESCCAETYLLVLI